MQVSSEDRAAMSEINVTPFVDVMLVLLIIFMVTAPLLQYGVDVDLPDSRVDAVRQCEVDDAKLAAEIKAGFGAPGCEFAQARPLSAGQHQRQRLARQSADKSCVFLELYVIHRATRPLRLRGSRPLSDPLPPMSCLSE